jgi:8-oxo-dGTP diphosphatase
LWEFVGGKVESGETREQALIRECREELDITVVPRDIFMEVTHEYPDLTVHLTLFNADLPQGEPKALEHNELRWITVDEIDQLAFCPADEEILERLKRK